MHKNEACCIFLAFPERVFFRILEKLALFLLSLDYTFILYLGEKKMYYLTRLTSPKIY
jgi:hypothetical protein